MTRICAEAGRGIKLLNISTSVVMNLEEVLWMHSRAEGSLFDIVIPI